MNRNFDEIIFNCITSVNDLMTSNEVAEEMDAFLSVD